MSEATPVVWTSMASHERWRALGLSLILGLAAVAASAQTDAEVNAGIQFNFSVPGARSLGLGGAFLGLADDATAAYANPAGLTNLSRPEVSLEARSWSFDNEFTDRGRVDGEPTGAGIDTLRGLQMGTSDNNTRGASFFSMVYPGRRWAVALYRHELAHFDAGFATQGALLNTSSRLRPARNSLSLEITNYGFSTAYRFGDSLSLGVGLSYYDFDLHSRTLRYDLGRLNGVGPGDFLGPARYADDNVFDLQTQDGADHKMAVNLGLAWKIERDWRVGAVYRQGPGFDFETSYLPGPRRPAPAEAHRRARFDIPDMLGIGTAYQPTDFTTFSLDYVHIRYSELTRRLVDIFPRKDEATPDLSGFQIDDGDEIHLGIEHVFAFSKALFALRAGAWRDPDHRMRYEGSDPSLRALFLRGEDEIHYSSGLGLIGDKFQIDLAFDLSDRVSASSLSTVVRF